MASLLIYGAYGYSGRLIAEQACAKGFRPILGGRDPQKVSQLAQELDLSYRVFTVEDTAELESALQEVEVVLNCAGPFVHTIRPMIKACLKTHTHYLDITGEMMVFEIAARYGKYAKLEGIMLLPGVGFDVVPTDCMAAHLKKRLPTAKTLELAFKGSGGFSHGTATTAIENLGGGGWIREKGKLTKVPIAHATKSIQFGEKALPAVAIPWGDISTAWYSTGIPNITVFAAQPKRMIQLMKAGRYFQPLLASQTIQNYLKKRVAKMPTGPSESTRNRHQSTIVGEARDLDGNVVKSRIKVEDGYTFTALSAVNITRRVLMGQFKPGFQTPATAFGESIVCKISETKFEDFE